jgi:hypothetical protein
MGAKKSNFYLTREELIREIVLSKKKHRESNEPKTPAECFTPKLTLYLQLMVNKYANKGQWRGYSYISDMKSDALLTLCQNAFKYNEEKYDNPFGYYTQIIKYCFITFLEKEEIIRDIKDSLWESIGMTPSYARQIKNEMMKDTVHQSSKSIKALKKDVDFLNGKIDLLSSIAKRLIRNNDADMDIDFDISEALEIEVRPFTSDLEATLSLFLEPPRYIVEHAIEIAGSTVDCLSVVDESTNSRTRRVLPDMNEQTIVVSLCSIALAIRRDLLVRRLREISGYNLANTRIPTAERLVPVQSEYEYTEEPRMTMGDFVATAGKRKGKKKE